MLALGFSRRGIQHRVVKGRLYPVAWGVYAVGRPDLTREGEWMAAVLSCGQGAVLSHASAAALLGLWPGHEDEEVEVSVRSRTPVRRAGIQVHRRPGLPPRAVGTFERIPVTSPVQTLIDLASRQGREVVERAVNEADRLDLVNPPALRRALGAHRGEPGVGRLRDLLDRRTFRLTRSRLEQLFLPMVRRVGLPVPTTKAWVNGFEVDFYWPALSFVVETDGLRHHRTPAQQARDRLRDQAHTAAGMRHLRFTHEQVRYEPDHVLAILAATARLLGVDP